MLPKWLLSLILVALLFVSAAAADVVQVANNGASSNGGTVTQKNFQVASSVKGNVVQVAGNHETGASSAVQYNSQGGLSMKGSVLQTASNNALNSEDALQVNNQVGAGKNVAQAGANTAGLVGDSSALQINIQDGTAKKGLVQTGVNGASAIGKATDIGQVNSITGKGKDVSQSGSNFAFSVTTKNGVIGQDNELSATAKDNAWQSGFNSASAFGKQNSIDQLTNLDASGKIVVQGGHNYGFIRSTDDATLNSLNLENAKAKNCIIQSGVNEGNVAYAGTNLVTQGNGLTAVICNGYGCKFSFGTIAQNGVNCLVSDPAYTGFNQVNVESAKLKNGIITQGALNSAWVGGGAIDGQQGNSQTAELKKGLVFQSADNSAGMLYSWYNNNICLYQENDQAVSAKHAGVVQGATNTGTAITGNKGKVDMTGLNVQTADNLGNTFQAAHNGENGFGHKVVITEENDQTVTP